MITIRQANPADSKIIADFQILMALETEQLKLHRRTVVAGVKQVFARPEHGCYFVAENQGSIIASLLITYEWSDWRNGTIYWIQSVFVKPEFRNRGVFKTMYQHIKALVLSDNRVMGIRLYVDKFNTTARTIYEKIQMNGDHYALYEWMK